MRGPCYITINFLTLFGKKPLPMQHISKIDPRHAKLGISRGQAKPRGSRVRVPAGTGAGRPGNTPDPCKPDPCIPESVTRPVLPAMLHTPVAVSFFTVQLSRLHHTHHTPSLARTTAMKAHEGPQQPTKADEEGKGP